MSSFTLLVLKWSLLPSSSFWSRWLKVLLTPLRFKKSEAVSALFGHFWLLGQSWGPMNGTMKEVISLGVNKHLNEMDLSQMPRAGTIWRVLSKHSTRSQADEGSNDTSWIIFSFWWNQSIFFRITSAVSVMNRRIIWSFLVTMHSIWLLLPLDTSVADASLMSTLLIKVFRLRTSFSFILCCCRKISKPLFTFSFFQSQIYSILELSSADEDMSAENKLSELFTANLSLELH